MDIIQEKLIDAMEIMIDEKLEKLTFNRTLECKIIEELTSPYYKVLSNDDEYTAKAINEQVYMVGDLVYVLVLNNNTSSKVILSKIP